MLLALPLIPCVTLSTSLHLSLGQCILKAVKNLKEKGSVGIRQFSDSASS